MMMGTSQAEPSPGQQAQCLPASGTQALLKAPILTNLVDAVI